MYGSFLVADADGCKGEFTKIQVRLNSALAQGPYVRTCKQEKKREAVQKGSRIFREEKEGCVYTVGSFLVHVCVITYILCIRVCMCAVVAMNKQIQHVVTELKEATKRITEHQYRLVLFVSSSIHSGHYPV